MAHEERFLGICQVDEHAQARPVSHLEPLVVSTDIHGPFAARRGNHDIE
jgi:hypothetical protein